MLGKPGTRVAPPQYIDFQPSTEWMQDPINHILLLYLPGFKQEEIKVKAGKTGKLTIAGRRKVGLNRFVRFEKTFDMPKDSEFKGLSGKFEDGKLYVTIPKAAMAGPEKFAMPPVPSKEEPAQQEKPKTSHEERKGEAAEEIEEPTPQTKPKITDEEKKGAAAEEEKEESASEKATFQGEQRKEEALKDVTEKPRSKVEVELVAVKSEEGESLKETEKKEAAIPAEKQPLDGLERNKEMPSSIEEKKREEPTVDKDKPSGVEKKNEEEETTRQHKMEMPQEKKEETVKKEEPKATNSHEGLQQIAEEKECRKRRRFWMDCRIADDLLKTIDRNIKYIAVALVAFSTALYITQKLRRRGR